MSPDPTHLIAGELSCRPEQVARTLELLDGGATVPFIARYRKEATGELDEEQIASIQERAAYLKELEDRRKTVLESIREQGKLTTELAEQIRRVRSKTELEDLYLPFRPKRRTRATMARERGLEPLARLIWEQRRPSQPPERLAAPYVAPDRGVPDASAAWAGARDILAERMSEDAPLRGILRDRVWRRGALTSRVAKGKEQEGAKFRDYFEYQEPVTRMPSHRALAVLRGEKEGVLKVRVRLEPEEALSLVRRHGPPPRGGPFLTDQLDQALEDCWNRLLEPAMETECRTRLRTQAEEEAIRVFARNLRQILMAPPLGARPVLAADPGFRTGCKLAVLSAQGDLLHHSVIYLHQADRARRELAELVKRFKPEAVAIGNGTASRETEALIRDLVREERLIGAMVVVVSESGASVYSASPLAREELPEVDITVRGAVSIGRRLQDPLAELVKIDPKAIGVGQYQHDVHQGNLKDALDREVASCVNAVGVEVNTASPRLLSYVSGIGPTLASSLVAYRAENGPFRSRRELLKVPRLGPKAFEQCAGFLRVRDGSHPLDATAVHPERYRLVETMARDAGLPLAELLRSPEARRKIDLRRYLGPEIGEPTLRDILDELARPGRDPRERFEAVEFDPEITELQHLQPGMTLPGVVTNLTHFGAFVDVGVHQDGLVHVSQIADRFIRDPAEELTVGQTVRVRVLEVDLQRKRISLSIKACQQTE